VGLGDPPLVENLLRGCCLLYLQHGVFSRLEVSVGTTAQNEDLASLV
jgi:hypothetical protein